MTDDGNPASTKSLKAYVEGTLTVQATSDEITNVATLAYSANVTSPSGYFPGAGPDKAFDGLTTTSMSAPTSVSPPIVIDLSSFNIIANTSVKFETNASFLAQITLETTSGNSATVGINNTTGRVEGLDVSKQGEQILTVTVGGAPTLSLIEVDGQVLIDTRTLTLASDQDLTLFLPGDAVQQDSPYQAISDTITNVAGNVLTVASDQDLANFAVGDVVQNTTGDVNIVAIDGAAPSITVDGGDWFGSDASGTPGGDTVVTGQPKTASGTVASTDPGANTMTLSSSTGTWAQNVGKFVLGPAKPTANARLYTVHDANGNISDLTSIDPGFVTQASGTGPFTLTFPATLPSGNAPDDELPAGTTIRTEIQASNASGSDTGISNIVTPSRP
jgi:hypothetical protein